MFILDPNVVEEVNETRCTKNEKACCTFLTENAAGFAR
jgi:hypothetical protein